MEAHLNRKLQSIADAMPGWDAAKLKTWPLVGGLMNSNWLINHDGQDYFMKLFGEGSENFVDRRLSYEAASQAHALGISPRIALFDPEMGVEIVEFLRGYRASTNADFSRRDFLQSVVELYRQFNSGQKLSTTKDVFAMTDEHIEQGRELGVLVPADFDWLLVQYERAKAAFMASGLDLAPCHNDAMPGNFMVAMTEDDRIKDMKMIDFEFASNNERAYEIGIFFGEVFVDEVTTNELIEQYYGTARREFLARVWVIRAVADIKWGSWAVQQRRLSSWDFDFQKYGIWKYARARRLFDDPRWNEWLAAI